MARVPTIQNPTVEARGIQPAAMSDAKVRDSSTPGAFGADIGTSMSQLGQAADGAADVLFAADLEEKKRQNEAEAKDAESALIEYERQLLHDPKTGYMNKSGRAAVDGREEVVKSLREKARELGGTLKSPYAQRYFKESTDPRIGARSVDVSKHASRQQAAWEAVQSEARVEGAVDDAVNSAVGADGSPDMRQIGINSALARTEIHEQAEREGWPSEKVTLEIERVQSTIHKGVIGRLLAQPGGVMDAKEYYGQNRDEVSGTDKSEIEAALKDGVVKADAIVKSDDIVNKAVKDATKAAAARTSTGGREGTEAPKVRVSDWFGAAMSEADKIADPLLRETTRNKVVDRAKQLQDVETQRLSAAWEGAVDHVDRGGNPNDLPFAVRDELGVVKMNSLRAQYETAGRRVTTPAGMSYADDLYSKSDAEVARMDPREMRAELNDDDYNEAVSLVKAARDRIGGTVSAYDPRNSGVTGYIKTVLEGAGLGGSEDKEQRGKIILNVVAALRAKAAIKGSGLTMDEEREVIDRVNMQVGEAGWFSDPETIVEIDSVSDIPDADVEDIKAVLKANNPDAEPTDDQIINIFIQYQLLNGGGK